MFQKNVFFCYLLKLLQLLPLIPLIPSIRSTGGLTCLKVFTGYWILQFISPLANLLLCLLLYLPFFCLLPFFTATATSLSNSLFHPASVESTETGTGIKLFQPVSLSQQKFLCSAILKSLRQYWHLTCFNLLRQSTCFVSKNVFVKCYL